MTNFFPIRRDDYVELHLRANPGTDRAELVAQLNEAIEASIQGERCRCGRPIWILGSSQVGYMCFTCITGESMLDSDYEIDVTEFLKRDRESLPG